MEHIADYEHSINLSLTADSYRQPKHAHNHVNTSVIPLLNLIFLPSGCVCSEISCIFKHITFN